MIIGIHNDIERETVGYHIDDDFDDDSSKP
jgi:hypothetical protein